MSHTREVISQSCEAHEHVRPLYVYDSNKAEACCHCLCNPLLCLQGTTAFIASAWATHAASCRVHNLGLFQPSKSLFLAGAVTLWGTRLAGYLFWRVLQTGKDSRLSFLFPKDDKEPFLTGQSKYVLLTCALLPISFDTNISY